MTRQSLNPTAALEHIHALDRMLADIGFHSDSVIRALARDAINELVGEEAKETR